MGENSTNISAKLLDMVQLISENEVKAEMGEAFASFMLNPTVTWAKFVLTDDKVNANGERIPKTEFANLIKSGIHMPVKMVVGEIQGHPDSKPLGTITHLKQVDTDDGGSAIVALAALWGRERPADIEYIKQRFAERKSVDVSWEVLYDDRVLNTETQSMDLLGTILKAATIVGNPAYQGRTPFLAVASRNEQSEAETEDNGKTEDTSMEVNDLEARIAELEPKLNDAQAQLESLATQLSEKEAEIARLTTELEAKEAELTPLRQFKEEFDAEVAKAEKLSAIKSKFTEAGLEKDDEYFEKHAEALLKLDEDGLSFFIQELAANLSTDSKTSDASKKTSKIPNLVGQETGEELNLKVLAKYLRENKGKK